MNAWTIILDIVLILISIVLIIAVLLQQGQRQGLGAIAGGAETFFGKNKAKSYEAKMAKITKIGAAIFIVAAIAATIVASHTGAADTTDATGDVTAPVEETTDGETATDETAADETTTDETAAADDAAATDETDAATAEATEAPEAATATEAPAEATDAPAEDVTEESTETEAPTEAPAAE